MSQPTDCQLSGHVGSGLSCPRCGVRIDLLGQQVEEHKKITKTIVFVTLLSVGGLLLVAGILASPPSDEPTVKPSEERAAADPQGWPAWVTTAPLKPPDWTTVTHARDALRLCYYELNTLEQYYDPNDYQTHPSPDDVEEMLAWAVFDNGWPNSWTKPDGLPPGTQDIWGYGHMQGCWDGVPGAFKYREEQIWNPQWR